MISSFDILIFSLIQLIQRFKFRFEEMRFFARSTMTYCVLILILHIIKFDVFCTNFSTHAYDIRWNVKDVFVKFIVDASIIEFIMNNFMQNLDFNLTLINAEVMKFVISSIRFCLIAFMIDMKITSTQTF